jgi:hypothetical protein
VLLFTAFNNRLIADVTALTPLGAIGQPAGALTSAQC